MVGLFPEGKRSRTGWMEPSLREGAARLAWETGALLVPATIAGAYRAWPYFAALPRPGAHPRPLPRADRPRAVPQPARGGGAAGDAGGAAPPRGPLAAAGRQGRPAHDAPLRLARLRRRACTRSRRRWRWRSCSSCARAGCCRSRRPRPTWPTSCWTGAGCRSRASRSGSATPRPSSSCSRPGPPCCARSAIAAVAGGRGPGRRPRRRAVPLPLRAPPDGR